MPELWDQLAQQGAEPVSLWPNGDRAPLQITVGGPTMKDGSQAPGYSLDPFNPPPVEYVGRPIAEKLASLFSGPSWLQRATEQTEKDKAAFQAGGVPALMADTAGGQELAGGFGGTTVGKLAPALMEAPVVASPFYSAAGRAVDNAKLGKGTADQWLGYLRNQPGVKPEELQYVFGNLPEGQLTKAQMQAHAAQNEVRLGEVVKGNPLEKELMTPDSPGFDPDRIQRANPAKYSQWQLPGGENYRETLLTLPQKTPPEGYSIAQNPNGTWSLNNARGELIVARPTRESLEQGIKENPGWFPSFRSSHWDEPNVLAHVRTNDREIPGVGKSLHVEEIQSDWHQKGRSSGYQSGKVPTADDVELKFIKGNPPPDAVDKSVYPGYWESIDKSDGSMIGRHRGSMTEAEAMAQAIGDLKHKAHNTGVPDAPFKSTWADVALKRQIREASEKGYDAISWTPGEAQAARYDLSKYVKSLHYDQSEGKLVGTDHNGRQVISEYTDATPEAFEPIIGKESAKKLHDAIKSKQYDREQWTTYKNEEGRWEISDPNGETLHDHGGDPVAYRHRGEANEHIDDMLKEDAMREGSGHPEITGLDLKVGGEGMRAFYDKMLVDKANAIGKKHGARVEQSALSTPAKMSTVGEVVPQEGGGWKIQWDDGTFSGGYGNRNNAEVAMRMRAEKVAQQNERPADPVHVLRITPELRAAAMKGFPLFSLGAGGAVLAPGLFNNAAPAPINMWDSQ